MDFKWFSILQRVWKQDDIKNKKEQARQCKK